MHLCQLTNYQTTVLTEARGTSRLARSSVTSLLAYTGFMRPIKNGSFCTIVQKYLGMWFPTCNTCALVRCVWQDARYNMFSMTPSTINLTISSTSPCHVRGFLICGYFIPLVHGGKQRVYYWERGVSQAVASFVRILNSFSLNHTFFFYFFGNALTNHSIF